MNAAKAGALFWGAVLVAGIAWFPLYVLFGGR